MKRGDRDRWRYRTVPMDQLGHDAGVTVTPISMEEIERLMRAEGLSFEEAAGHLMEAVCPICNPPKEN